MTNFAHVNEKGEVDQIGVPTSGRLANGRSVSGLDILVASDPKVANAEGWLPLTEDRPELGDGEQYGAPTYAVVKGQVVATYPVVAIPVPAPTQAELIEQYATAVADAQTNEELRQASATLAAALAALVGGV